MSGERWSRGAFVGWAGLILVLTLTPVPGGEVPESSLCILCGTRGAADAILNLLLFLPLGYFLARAGFGWRRPVAVAVILALAIELAQMWIPGRHPTPGDALTNTLGAAVGVLVALVGVPGRPPRGRVPALVAALAVAASFVLTAWLLAPSYPTDQPYYSQWTPDLGHLETYGGRVLAVTVAGRPAPPGRVADAAAFREALGPGPSIRVTVQAGPETRSLSSIFSVYDHASREVVLVGADGPDLVFRRRSRAAGLRLDSPDFRGWGLMAGKRPGDTLSVGVESEEGGLCLSVDDRRRCGIGWTAGSGWSLLLAAPFTSRTARSVLGLAWVAGLFAVLSWSAPDRRTLLWSVSAAAGALLGVPFLSALVATPVGQIAGAGLGVVAGRLARRAGRPGTLAPVGGA